MKDLYRYYYKRLKLPPSATDNQIHLLNASERKAIRRLEIRAMILSGVIGTVAVLLLYLPQYQFPQLFPNYEMNLSVIGKVTVPLVSTIYGIVLVFLEIWALTLLHLYCIHHIGVATGFITEETKYVQDKQEKILSVSTEEKDKTLKNYGINPYQGLKMTQVWLFNLLLTLKATLSNMVVKILIRRFFGRYAVREVLDLAGIPVFAFWNIVATRTILREARVMIMGQNMIEAMIPQLEKKAASLKYLPNTKKIIYDTLQFIAVSKRDYHANHAYMTDKILKIFEIPIENQHLMPPDYAHRLAKADIPLNRFCQLLIIIGLLLDGQISWRERRRITDLNKEGILYLTISELIDLKNDFLTGRGIGSLVEEYLGEA
jgi:hypothetical protein